MNPLPLQLPADLSDLSADEVEIYLGHLFPELVGSWYVRTKATCTIAITLYATAEECWKSRYFQDDWDECKSVLARPDWYPCSDVETALGIAEQWSSRNQMDCHLAWNFSQLIGGSWLACLETVLEVSEFTLCHGRAGTLAEAISRSVLDGVRRHGLEIKGCLTAAKLRSL